MRVFAPACHPGILGIVLTHMGEAVLYSEVLLRSAERQCRYPGTGWVACDSRRPVSYGMINGLQSKYVGMTRVNAAWSPAPRCTAAARIAAAAGEITRAARTAIA